MHLINFGLIVALSPVPSLAAAATLESAGSVAASTVSEKSVCQSFDGNTVNFTDPISIIARIPPLQKSEFETLDAYKKRLNTPLKPEGKLYVVKTTAHDGVFNYNAETGKAEFGMSSFGADDAYTSTAAFAYDQIEFQNLSFRTGLSFTLQRSKTNLGNSGTIRNERDRLLVLHDFSTWDVSLSDKDVWTIPYTVQEAMALKRNAKTALVIRIDHQIAFESSLLMPARLGVPVNNKYNYSVFAASVVCGLMYISTNKVVAYFDFE